MGVRHEGAGGGYGSPDNPPIEAIGSELRFSTPGKVADLS